MIEENVKDVVHMIEENVKIASKFLRKVYDEDIAAIGQILNAEADNDKVMLRDYLECVKDFSQRLIDSLA